VPSLCVPVDAISTISPPFGVNDGKSGPLDTVVGVPNPLKVAPWNAADVSLRVAHRYAAPSPTFAEAGVACAPAFPRPMDAAPCGHAATCAPSANATESSGYPRYGGADGARGGNPCWCASPVPAPAPPSLGRVSATGCAEYETGSCMGVIDDSLASRPVVTGGSLCVPIAGVATGVFAMACED